MVYVVAEVFSQANHVVFLDSNNSIDILILLSFAEICRIMNYLGAILLGSANQIFSCMSYLHLMVERS